MAAFDLPDELAATYGGSLGFSQPRLFANFVESLDGVTAIPHLSQSNELIAAASEADRFVMGLLRACADAVLIGAGTLGGSPRTRWTAEHAYRLQLSFMEICADGAAAHHSRPWLSSAVVGGSTRSIRDFARTRSC